MKLRRVYWVAIFAVTTPSGDTVTVASTPQCYRNHARAHAASIIGQARYANYRLNSIVRVAMDPYRR